MQVSAIGHEKVKSQFPSLKKTINGSPVSYLDGPAGTQVPQVVINAISDYYKNSNSNTLGFFQNSKETDEVIRQARVSASKFLGADGPETISFGQNMTTLAYALSKGIGRTLETGDEIIITELDHEANRGPWLALEEYGAKLVEVKITPQGTLDMDDFKSKITDRTKVIAMGCASNAFGTVNDFKTVRKWSREVNALLILDAVHYAPHFPIDVNGMDCDFLFCSAYKFYGPHVGILYSKPGLLEKFPVDSLRTQYQQGPFKIETGTLNHAALAGVSACIDFITRIFGEDDSSSPQSAMEALSKHEKPLLDRLFMGIDKIPEATIYGPGPEVKRTPTVSFTFDNLTPEEVCTALGKRGIYAWDGHFYAIRPIEALGLMGRGGVTRLGVSMYTTIEDIDKTISAINELRNL